MRTTCCAVAVATAALSAASAAPAASAPPYDAHWLQNAVAAHRFEIAAGKLAAQRSHDGHLSALAGRLISDHTLALRATTASARRLGVKTKGLTPSMQWQLGILRGLPQADFARAYATLEIADHNENIILAGEEIKRGGDRQVRQLADKQSTMLAKHLRLARQALRSLPGA